MFLSFADPQTLLRTRSKSYGICTNCDICSSTSGIVYRLTYSAFTYTHVSDCAGERRVRLPVPELFFCACRRPFWSRIDGGPAVWSWSILRTFFALFVSLVGCHSHCASLYESDFPCGSFAPIGVAFGWELMELRSIIVRSIPLDYLDFDCFLVPGILSDLFVYWGCFAIDWREYRSVRSN